MNKGRPEAFTEALNVAAPAEGNDPAAPFPPWLSPAPP